MAANFFKILTKITFVSLLYIAFSIQGIFEEKIYGKKYKHPYKDETFRFQEPNLNYFTIALVSSILSGAIILSKNMKKKLYSIKDKFIMGTLYTIGKMASENSLRYLDFISKTIGKSVKSLTIVLISMLTKLPIIGHIIEIIIGQKVDHNKTTSKDILKGTISTLSLFLFSYDPKQHSSGISNTITIGYIFLIVSLVADGLLSLKEKLINKEVESHPEFEEYKHMISWYSMFILNITVVIITVPIYVYNFYFSETFVNNVKLYSQSPELLSDLFYLYSGALIGQIMVFQILERDGPLSLSIYTGSRKILSIFLSIFWYEKSISQFQQIALVLGLIIMVMEVFDKGSSSKSHPKPEGRPSDDDKTTSFSESETMSEDEKKDK